MFDERAVESYFHLISVQADRFIRNVQKVPGTGRHFMITALNTCLQIRAAQRNGSAGKWAMTFKLAAAGAAAQEIRQTAAAMAEGNGGSLVLDDAQREYMRKTSRVFSRYDDKLKVLSREYKDHFRRKLQELLKEE